MNFKVKVNRAGGERAILFPLPSRSKVAGIPTGETEVTLPDGTTVWFRFAKLAVNVAVQPPNKGNVLDRILKGWFGPDAGAPGGGVSAYVRIEKRGGKWFAAPEGRND
jgi:hypothetical protein